MRARNIKPGFFDNEDLADLGPYAQLLFEGLWCLADREGKLEDRPKRIKAKVFPYYEPKPSVDNLLDSLSKGRDPFIIRYEVDGYKYIKIINFLEHQSPHHTEKASRFPDPPATLTVNSPLNNGETSGDSRNQNGGNPPDSLIPDSLIPDSNNIMCAGQASAPHSNSNSNVPYQEIVDSWNQNAPPALPRVSKLTDKRRKKIKPAWKDYPNLEWWRTLFTDIRLSDWHSGRDSWKGADFDWVLNRRTELRETLDALKIKTRPSARDPCAASQNRGMPDDVVFPDPKCPICNGKGAIMQPDGSTRPCTCFKKREELKPDDREAAISLPTFRSGS